MSSFIEDWTKHLSEADCFDVTNDELSALHNWQPRDGAEKLAQFSFGALVNNANLAVAPLYRQLLAYDYGVNLKDAAAVRVVCLALARASRPCIETSSSNAQLAARHCRSLIENVSFSPFLFDLAPGAVNDVNDGLGLLFAKLADRIDDPAAESPAMWQNLALALHTGEQFKRFAKLVPQLARYRAGLKLLRNLFNPAARLMVLERGNENATTMRSGINIINILGASYNLKWKLDGDPIVLQTLHNTISNLSSFDNANGPLNVAQAQQFTCDALLLIVQNSKVRKMTP